MKKRLDDLFDEASAKELDVVMENKDFSAPLDDDVLARIEKQTLEKSGLAAPRAKKRIVKRVLLLSATFALLLAVTLGAVACAAEQKEYREALKFFEEHNLSTEGLTRGEIKAVYRDITLRRFTYSKTAEVIEKSVWTQRLEGVEILQNDPTPEEIEEIWERLKEGKVFDLSDWSFFEVEADGGVKYAFRRISSYNEQGEYVSEEHIACYYDDQLVWSYKLDLEYEFGIASYPLRDGLLVESQYMVFTNGLGKAHRRLLRINAQGEILWSYQEGDDDGNLVGCFDNHDGTLSVLFSHIESENGVRTYQLVEKRLNTNGEVLVTLKNEIGGLVEKASRGENGYLLVMTDADTDKTCIAVTDKNGKVIEEFTYSRKNMNYQIRDVIEYGGKIYFTADVTPTTGKAYLEYAKKTFKDGGSDDKLLKLLREHYTATLMVCDLSDGTPKECYSQKGAQTGTLSINESGVLIWDVKSIVSVDYTAYNRSFMGKCYVYQYAFDTNGKLLGQIQTERIQPFYK